MKSSSLSLNIKKFDKKKNKWITPIVLYDIDTAITPPPSFFTFPHVVNMHYVLIWHYSMKNWKYKRVRWMKRNLSQFKLLIWVILQVYS